MKLLTENTHKILQFIQQNVKSVGEEITISSIAEASGKTEKQLRPCITPGMVNPSKDGTRPALCTYRSEKVTNEEGKVVSVGYVGLTDAGLTFTNQPVAE